MLPISLKIRLARALTYVLAVVAQTFLAKFWRPYVTQRCGRRPSPPHAGDQAIDTAWLEAMLQDWHDDGVRPAIAAVELEDMSGRGFVGLMSRLNIEYADADAAEQAGFPATMVMKRSAGTIDGRKSVLWSGNYREASFYASSYATALPDGVLPLVYYAYGSGIYGEYVMLMEDLDKRDTVGLNLIYGNQVWGVPEGFEPRDNVETLERVYVQAAKVHAMFWRDNTLMRQGWMRGADWYRGKGQEQWEVAVALAKGAWARTKAGIDAGTSELKIAPHIRAFVDASYDITSWETLQGMLLDPEVPWTLSHNDFHAANMMLASTADGGDDLLWFDWSEVGPWEPMADLGQTIISDVKPEVFLGACKSLVKTYWETLVAHGVDASEFGFEQCWLGFKRSCIQRWVWLMPVMCGHPACPLVLNQYIVNQFTAFYDAFGDGTEAVPIGPVVCMG